MKPSGIEWLGDIPVHWEIRRLKSIGKAIIGLTYNPGDLTDGTGTLVLRSSNIKDGKIVFENNVYRKLLTHREMVYERWWQLFQNAC